MYESQVKLAGNSPYMLMKAAIYGIAVGDALGFPMQFQSRNYARKYPILDMGEYRYGAETRKFAEDRIGLWSDDTSLALCLAESLASGYDLQDMARINYAWLSDGYRSALERAFDIGRQCLSGIGQAKEFAEKAPSQLPEMIRFNIERANGNGALMRILPLMIQTYGQDLESAFKIVKEVSALTHPHIRSAFCCLYYLRFAERILNKMDKRGAFEETQIELRSFAGQIALSEKDSIELQRLLELDIRHLNPDAEENSPKYLSSSGYVVHSLEAALWCILNNDTFEDTLLAAVNLADDADSVAAIAGGVAALLYGWENIPKHWVDLLQSPQEIEAVLALYKTKTE